MSGLLSASMIIPDEHRAAGNAAHIAMGRADEGVSIYSVPLSPTGAEPATDWGCHTWASAEWVATMQQAQQDGILPPADWAAVGTTEEAVRAALYELQMSTKPDGEHEGHFDNFIATLGLQRIIKPRGTS